MRGSDGILMAVDALYELREIENPIGDQRFHRWLKCHGIRYAANHDAGSENIGAIRMSMNGPLFESIM